MLRFSLFFIIKNKCCRTPNVLAAFDIINHSLALKVILHHPIYISHAPLNESFHHPSLYWSDIKDQHIVTFKQRSRGNARAK